MLHIFTLKICQKWNVLNERLVWSGVCRRVCVCAALQVVSGGLMKGPVVFVWDWFAESRWIGLSVSLVSILSHIAAVAPFNSRFPASSSQTHINTHVHTQREKALTQCEVVDHRRTHKRRKEGETAGHTHKQMYPGTLQMIEIQESFMLNYSCAHTCVHTCGWEQTLVRAQDCLF